MVEVPSDFANLTNRIHTDSVTPMTWNSASQNTPKAITLWNLYPPTGDKWEKLMSTLRLLYPKPLSLLWKENTQKKERKGK